MMLTLAALCCTYAAAVQRKLAAFNIQVFGPSKAGKPDVMNELCQILQEYDIVLIQEIRNSDGTAIVSLLDQLNNEPGVDGAYAMEIGERVGRTSSKEQYCYFYRTAIFEIPMSS
ncbi:endonuclease/exonuclease/phosphatase family protein, partial [Salmonella sp. s55044]|uniref:endonuclease/exonuclease/phosphatase family protein n=1 Tax=Salmonella sp. s55044 TaxID=3159677 RepID=UPI0039808A43